jgi:hypothetical protein
MTTFDIALKHLKGLDFRNPDIFSDRELIERHIYYKEDKLNIRSNDHYRGLVFYACVYHLHDLALKKFSYFDVACEIIESMVPSFDKHMKTEYPKNMVDQWNNYCNSIINPDPYMETDNEVRFNIFCVAYHYLQEKK